MLNALYVRFDALIESPAFAEAGIYKARLAQFRLPNYAAII